MSIDEIQKAVQKAQYRYSDHAVKQMIKRAIGRNELEDAIIKGEIIEEYPYDKYSASCLIYGKTTEGRDLHIQVSLPPDVVVITTYEPDAGVWIDCRHRR